MAQTFILLMDINLRGVVVLNYSYDGDADTIISLARGLQGVHALEFTVSGLGFTAEQSATQIPEGRFLASQCERLSS